MKRRAFLQVVGAFAASAAIPKALAIEGICRAPEWWNGPVQLFRTTPLVRGHYTFTAWPIIRDGKDLGSYYGGFKANGGETLFEVPDDGPYPNPNIALGGVLYELPENSWNGHSFDIQDCKLKTILTPVEKL